MIRHERLRDNYLGLALGLATGDALGSPFEFMSRHQVELKHGRVTEMVGGGWLKLKPGEWADDTSQFLLALESAVLYKGFDGLDVAGRLVEWLQAGDPAISTELKELLKELEEDPERWTTVARERWYESAGVLCTNTCLSRVPVAAMLYPNDLGAMAEATMRSCQVTHFDPRCVDAALALNFLLVQGLNNRWGRELLGQAWQFVEAMKKGKEYRAIALSFDRHVLDTHANLTPLPTYHEDSDSVLRALRHVATMKYDDLGTSTYVVHTLQTATWIAFNAESFEEGLSMAVGLGGESDTQGAIAGALLGVRFGYNSIPTIWLKNLKERSRISSLAEILLGAAQHQAAPR